VPAAQDVSCRSQVLQAPICACAEEDLVDGYVYVKLVGDVNDDGIVDIFDIGSISAHWYPGPPEGPLGYDSQFDLNDDGNIDISDIEIVSAQWGETA